MKKMILLLIFSFALLSFNNNPYPLNNDNQGNQGNQPITTSAYCDGWADGYCEGWKDVKGTYAICPVTPICPIAEIGKTTYKDGYNRGFKAGSAAAKR